MNRCSGIFVPVTNARGFHGRSFREGLDETLVESQPAGLFEGDECGQRVVAGSQDLVGKVDAQTVGEQVDGDGVTVTHQREWAAADCLGRDLANGQAPVQAGELAGGDHHHVEAETGTVDCGDEP